MILISTHAEQDYADLIAASPAVGFLSKSTLSAGAIRNEVVPGLVEVEAAVPRLSPAVR
jgi:hypothetical protein